MVGEHPKCPQNENILRVTFHAKSVASTKCYRNWPRPWQYVHVICYILQCIKQNKWINITITLCTEVYFIWIHYPSEVTMCSYKKSPFTFKWDFILHIFTFIIHLFTLNLNTFSSEGVLGLTMTHWLFGPLHNGVFWVWAHTSIWYQEITFFGTRPPQNYVLIFPLKMGNTGWGTSLVILTHLEEKKTKHLTA